MLISCPSTFRDILLLILGRGRSDRLTVDDVEASRCGYFRQGLGLGEKGRLSAPSQGT